MNGGGKLRGWWRVGLLVLVALSLAASTAPAKRVRATSSPLPGSKFLGGNGDQANPPPPNPSGFFDWQGLEARGQVNHKADCNLPGVPSCFPPPDAGKDDVFAGGNKETSPGAWKIIAEPSGSATPASANILDAYWAFHHGTGDAFLYLSFTREAPHGTEFITFELNQHAQLWHNMPPPAQPIPCRTTGDILIEFQPRGVVLDNLQVYEWITDTGAVDPASECATDGKLEPLPGVTFSPSATANVQAAFNDSPITNYLPTSLTYPMGMIGTGNFGEAAINLSSVLSGDQDACSRFASIWMNSRSSGAAGTSQMKDYVAPTPFLIRTCKASPSLTTQASGTVNRKARGKHRLRRHARLGVSITDEAILTGGDNPTGTISFKLYGPHGCVGSPIFTSSDRTVNGNGPYMSDPYTPITSGTYSWAVEYSGDDNNNGTTVACGVDQETVTIEPPPSHARPTLTTVASPATLLGKPISDSATLANGLDPTGTIMFDVYGPFSAGATPTCTGATATPTSTVIVDRGNDTYTSASFSPSSAGTYEWVARYSGDSNNTPAATSCGDTGESVLVTAAAPPVAPALTSTASTGGPIGSAIQDTAHLSGGSSPTGTITFHVYGPNSANCSTPAGPPSTVPVSGAGDYHSASFTPMAAGTYRWVATYSGDANNAAAATSCSDATEAVTVPQAQPAISTSASPVSVKAGAAVGDTAHLSGGANPQGTIAFRLYGPNDRACSAPPAFVVEQVVNGNGSYASPTPSPALAGTYRWVATYSGDANNASAATACGDAGETVVVRPVKASQRPEEVTRPRPKPHRPPKPTVTG